MDGRLRGYFDDFPSYKVIGEKTAYAPRPELANQITRALDPESLPENVTPIRPASATSFLERLEEEIPAKWLREVERIFAEGHMPLPAHDDPALSDERSRSEHHPTAVETAIP